MIYKCGIKYYTKEEALERLSFCKEEQIKIYGFDVELYIQDINEKHISNGIYSLLTDCINSNAGSALYSFLNCGKT